MDVTRFGTIGVLMGGYSSERAISLKSGQAIFNALHEEGCSAVSLDIIEDDKEKIITFLRQADIDIAFVALHGELGEDGQIQLILEEMNGLSQKRRMVILIILNLQKMMIHHQDPYTLWIWKNCLTLVGGGVFPLVCYMRFLPDILV